MQSRLCMLSSGPMKAAHALDSTKNMTESSKGSQRLKKTPYFMKKFTNRAGGSFLFFQMEEMEKNGQTKIRLHKTHTGRAGLHFMIFFSAFWLRSKCSICSYQLNIWYGDHVSPSILNWFLQGDEVQELAPASSRVGLALQYRQDRLTPHFLMRFYLNVAACFITPEWVSSGLRSIGPTQSCCSHHLKSSEHIE